MRLVLGVVGVAIPFEAVLAQPLPSPPGDREMAIELRHGPAFANGGTRLGSPSPPPSQSEGVTIGRDKRLHFTVSAAWTGGAYAGLARGTEWPPSRTLGVAAGSAALLGVGKEIRDAYTEGDASGKDLLANALGIGAAIGVILIAR